MGLPPSDPSRIQPRSRTRTTGLSQRRHKPHGDLLDRLTVEEEVALIKSGKLRKLALVATLAALVGTGAAFWMKGIGTREAYANAAASARKLRNDKLEAFARCALPQTPPAQFDSKSALLNALESYGDRYG